MASVGGFRRVLRVHVEVLQQAGLRERRFIVDPRAAVPMAARSDLEVKRAVDPKKETHNNQAFKQFLWRGVNTYGDGRIFLLKSDYLLVLFCAKNRGKILGHRFPLTWCLREDVSRVNPADFVPATEVAKRFFSRSSQ